ncbi:hypothetical protein H6B07_14230 [Mediterraneibacter glycyrrhizinilyticus]|nr:hypothetical protein [Mediterraneibacter glycyrrhizinilyticus]
MRYNKTGLKKANAKNRTGLLWPVCFQRVSVWCEETAWSGTLSPASSQGEKHQGRQDKLKCRKLINPDRNSPVIGKTVKPQY